MIQSLYFLASARGISGSAMRPSRGTRVQCITHVIQLTSCDSVSQCDFHLPTQQLIFRVVELVREFEDTKVSCRTIRHHKTKLYNPDLNPNSKPLGHVS